MKLRSLHFYISRTFPINATKGSMNMSVTPVSSAQATTAVAAQESVTRSPQAGPRSAPEAKDNEAVESQSKASKTTVKISNAGKAALEEATETAAQTAREASGGDQQAQRAIEKAAALKSAQK